MRLHEYQILAGRTAKMEPLPAMLNHVALGAAGEAGELADAIKRYTVYGKPLDEANALEELGDLLWYVAFGCTALGVSLADVAKVNIEKLSKRYPDRYTDEYAAARLDKTEQ